MTIALHGIGVSKGIAIGRVHLIDHAEIEISEYTLSRQDLEAEVQRLLNAVAVAHAQLLQIRNHAAASTTSQVDITSFIDTHLLMLEDTLLVDSPIQFIREQQCNAEWALKLHCDNLVKVFDDMDDPYLSARKQDIENVITRLQRILRGYTDLPIDPENADLTNTIIVADDLSPADTAMMQHKGVLAFVTEYGGHTSHTAILARSLAIPAIVGLRHLQPYIKSTDTLIVDGFSGTVLIDPDETLLRYYRMRQREEKRYRTALNKIKHAPTQTLDGIPISLQANIEFPEDMVAVRRVGGEGVGLYRTEFLFMNRNAPPDEEEHFDAYLRVIRALKGGTVTIRTFDLGADKQFDTRVREDGDIPPVNPALGLRAVRICLKDQSLFRPQIRAILRASAFGSIKMMIPMVSGMQEIQQVRTIVKEIQQELTQKNITFDTKLPIGVMVEVPSIAICADLYAPLVDFFSIGTNDLIQYSLAIDRIDDSVSYLFDPIHPALLRLIKLSIDAANRANIPISMCGEMAGDSRYVRLLLGLGLRCFSVSPESYLEVKQIINQTDMQGLSRLCAKLLKTPSSAEIQQLLIQINSLPPAIQR